MHCNLECKHTECSAKTTVIRDQYVIGTHNNAIREEALNKS